MSNYHMRHAALSGADRVQKDRFWATSLSLYNPMPIKSQTAGDNP